MRQITITLIVLLALTMGMASCSHESPVPFLEEMGVCTDSLPVDSFPSKDSLFYRNPHPTWLNYEQSKKLGIAEFNPDSSWMLRESTKKRIKTFYCCITSVKRYQGNFLITFQPIGPKLKSVLYNSKGKILDMCYCAGYNFYGTINPDENVYVQELLWTHKYIGNDRYSISLIDTKHNNAITYLYHIANNNITLISRKSRRNVDTSTLDALMYPASQMNKACDIISKCNVSTDCPYYYYNDGMCGNSNFEDSIVQTFYPKYLVPLAKSNLPAMLKWIAAHKSDTKVATCLRYIYSDAFRGSHKKFKLQDLKKQILQIKDKESQQYLLKVLIRE